MYEYCVIWNNFVLKFLLEKIVCKYVGSHRLTTVRTFDQKENIFQKLFDQSQNYVT